jgi:hypothetical protein
VEDPDDYLELLDSSNLLLQLDKLAFSFGWPYKFFVLAIFIYRLIIYHLVTCITGSNLPLLASICFD